MKTEHTHIRTSLADKEILTLAATKYENETGKKGNVSKVILHSVQEFVEKEPKEKISYCIRDRYFQDLKGVYNRGLKYLTVICTDFVELNLGFPTIEDLESLTARSFDGIKKRYIEASEKDMENIKSHTLRESVIQESSQIFEDWQNKTLENVARFVKCSFYLQQDFPLSVEYYTLKEGRPFFTDENAEALKQEYCTIFIENEAQAEFVQIRDAALKNLNALKSILAKNDAAGIPLFSVDGVELGLFSENRETITLEDQEIISFIKN